MSNNPSKGSFKKLIRDFAVVMSITLLLLALVEGALRVLPIEIDPDGGRVPTELACEFHPDYLIKLRANMEKRFVNEKQNNGQEIVWHTNSLGFRGPELRDNPGLRVVVYGDSNVQARFSLLEDTFSVRLETELAEGLKQDVEVINAGVLGFGPDQSFLKLKEEAEKLKPDLVIMHFFADNDYGDVIRNRLFDLGPDGKLVKTTHKRVPDIVIANRGFFAKLAITRFIKSKKTKSLQRSFPKVEPLAVKRALEEFEVFRDGRAREYSHFDDHYDVIDAFMPESRVSAVMVKLVEEIFKGAYSFTDKKGIRFMVLIQPSSRDLTENVFPNHKDFAAMPGYSPRNLTGFAEAALERNGILGLNLFDVFSRNNPGSLFFAYKNDHWNNRGQALAARVSAAYIMENGLLE